MILEIDHQVRALGRRNKQIREIDRRGQQSLVGADLMKVRLVRQRQMKIARIRGIEDAEAILARLDLEERA